MADLTLTAGETLTVDAAVLNVGDSSGTETVELDVNGTVEDSQSVTLASPGDTDVSLSWTTDDTDGGTTQTVTVQSPSDSDSIDVRVDKRVADLSVTITGVTPDPPSIDETGTVAVDAMVENVGTGTARQVIRLVDIQQVGLVPQLVTIDRAAVELAPGNSTSITLHYGADVGRTGDRTLLVQSDLDQEGVTVSVSAAAGATLPNGTSVELRRGESWAGAQLVLNADQRVTEDWGGADLLLPHPRQVDEDWQGKTF